MGEPGPRGPARRAAALTRRLAPWRWRVTAWAGGYTVAGPCGAMAPARTVDDVVARARTARPDVLKFEQPGPGAGLDSGLAEAVVQASVAAALVGPGGSVVLGGPVGKRRVVIAHGSVEVRLVPDATWSVAAVS